MDWRERVARRLKLRDLQTLQAIVETGSMVRAAARLAVTQSAVSKSIAEIEGVLGMPLFERRARRVLPTPCARILLRRGAAIFDELRQGIGEVEYLADPTAGELRVGTTEPMAAVLSSVITRLSLTYPRVVFQVTVADTQVLLAELRERNIDLAITRMANKDAENDIAVDVLFHDPLAIIAGQRNPLAKRRRLALQELIDEPWTFPPASNFLNRFIEEAFRIRGLEPPRAVVTTSSIHMRNSLLAAGHFLTILPSAILRFPGYREWLKALPVRLAETSRPIGIITLKKRELGPVAQLFMKYVRATAKSNARD
jgi:DNA-binding transcriptional LysR family regulator